MRGLTLTILAALALSGCMGNGDTRLSEHEFFERTNAVCRAAHKASDWPTMFSPYDFSPREWSIELERVRAWTIQLRSLRPPAGLDDEWKTFLGAFERLRRADRDLFAVSPRPERGSKKWRRAWRQSDVAQSQMQRAASVLPLGISCRTGL